MSSFPAGLLRVPSRASPSSEHLPAIPAHQRDFVEDPMHPRLVAGSIGIVHDQGQLFTAVRDIRPAQRGRDVVSIAGVPPWNGFVGGNGFARQRNGRGCRSRCRASRRIRTGIRLRNGAGVESGRESVSAGPHPLRKAAAVKTGSTPNTNTSGNVSFFMVLVESPFRMFLLSR